MFVGSVSYYHRNEDTLRKFLEANDGAVVYIHMEIDADSVVPEVDGRELETCPPSNRISSTCRVVLMQRRAQTGKIPVACSLPLDLSISHPTFTTAVVTTDSISPIFPCTAGELLQRPAARSVYELEHQGSDMVTRAKYRRMAISKNSH